MVSKFFDEKTGVGVSGHEQLIEELRKLAIKKFKRRKVFCEI